MRRLLLAALACLVLVMLLPFAGPFLGMASFQELAPPPDRGARLHSGRINYTQLGDGPDVVLVHGQPGSGDMMRPLAAALAAQGFRTTRYDRMGWGHSDAVAAGTPANPTTHARDLLGLIGVLELEDPVVVGYSYGGGVAIEAERLEPGRTRVMALISSVGGPRPRSSHSLAGRIASSPVVMRWALGTDWTANFAAQGAFSAFAAPETLSVAATESLMASLALPAVPSHWARERSERYVGFDGYHPERVRACTLVIHGDEDQVVSASVGDAVADAIAGARLLRLPASGHAIVVTQAQRLAALIGEHVAGCRHAEG